MKYLILLCSCILVGCASSNAELRTFPERPFDLLQSTSGVGAEGGPVVKQDCLILYTDSTKQQVKAASCKSHAGPGTLQTAINPVISGVAHYKASKDRAPLSISGDSSLIFDVDGGTSNAGAMAESETRTDVHINTDEDKGYEIVE